ncbi:MAG: hypothetical protein IJZ69_04175 [Bacteroidales bacterium]|nr:hypothetical protein [Bacteroidales bacterium]
MNCCKEILTTAVAVVGDVLVLTLPAGTFRNCCLYPIRIAQAIPATATNLMPVVIQIGTDATQYSVVRKSGHNVYANQLKPRRVYLLKVAADTARFVLWDGLLCAENCGAVVSIPAPVAAAETAAVLSIRKAASK